MKEKRNHLWSSVEVKKPTHLYFIDMHLHLVDDKQLTYTNKVARKIKPPPQIRSRAPPTIEERASELPSPVRYRSLVSTFESLPSSKASYSRLVERSIGSLRR